MFWLRFGLVYAAVHILLAWVLRDQATARMWFGNLALVVPSMLCLGAIVRRRHQWSGCHRVFWMTIAAGAAAWAAGQSIFAVKQVIAPVRIPGLDWHALLNLVGPVAPLIALMARPHRGARPEVAAVATLEIVGLAVLVTYVHAYFVLAPVLLAPPDRGATYVLPLLAQAQRLSVFGGVALVAITTRGAPWHDVYRRIAVGVFVSFVGRALMGMDGMTRGGYIGTAFDLTWILPAFFTAWAAEAAPSSTAGEDLADGRPHAVFVSIIFTPVALIPILDVFVRRRWPLGEPADLFRDISTGITVMFVLVLLVACLRVEARSLRRVHARRRILTTALQQTGDLVLILGPTCRFEDANDAFCRQMGYTREELTDLPPRDLVAPDSLREYDALVEAVGRDGIGMAKFTRVRKDGSALPVAVTVVKVKGQDSSATHFVGVERDMTEELRTREQLIHTERLSAVGQLASGIAHEINNPLQTVVGLAELRLGCEEDPEARKDLERILGEARRAGRIAGNLLTFVRRPEPQRTLEDLNDVVRAAVALRSYELRVANIELTESYSAVMPGVAINRDEIQQIVLNLLLNAEQAVRAAGGPGRVSVRTSSEAGQAILEVEDNGPGVPASLSRRIFEPFFTTKSIGHGTGLGLSIAIGIATAHQGRLELVPSSTGAFFRLTLPPGPPATAPLKATVADSPDLPEEVSGSRGRRVLVVDDEAVVRDLLARLLARRGCQVDVAEDGAEGLELLDGQNYELILCDARMPRIGGLDFYRELGARRPELRRLCVFMSGDLAGGDLAEAAARYRVPLLAKPFTSSQLDAMLADVFAQPV